jgi:hypothetical protein
VIIQSVVARAAQSALDRAHVGQIATVALKTYMFRAFWKSEKPRSTVFEFKDHLMTNVAEKLPSVPSAVARSNTPPPGWGNDELSKFLQATHQQQYATFFNKREAVGRLVAIDGLFVRVSTGWLNPESEIEAMLFLRCHAAFRAAAGEAMAGLSSMPWNDGKRGQADIAEDRCPTRKLGPATSARRRPAHQLQGRLNVPPGFGLLIVALLLECASFWRGLGDRLRTVGLEELPRVVINLNLARFDLGHGVVLLFA